MSDGHQNGVETQRRRSPELDLNQAFTREEEEEEEDQEEAKGPHWLQVRQQEPWLQLREQDQADQQQKQKAMEASPSPLPKEQHQHQHQTVAENPNSHGGEKQSQQAMGENLNSLQEDQQQQQQGENLISGAMAKQNSHVMETWNYSDSMEVLRQKPSLMEDRKQNPERPALPSSPGTMWEHQRVVFPHGRKSLSPVSPPEQRKSLSPVSPDGRFSEEQLETALPLGRSSEKRTSPYRSPHRKHSPRGDSFSRWRHDQDLSMSPRDFFKRHRERSLSTSPAGRSNRVGRSRSRSPPLRGYHHSPRPRYSPPRGRYSPRRRSPPSSYRPKRRPWSPPPNRNTGLGKPGRNLFIAGFSFGTTERDLERKFSRYGHVKDVRIVRDKRSGDSRGFGFLSLDRDEDADAAIRGLDQTEWNGRIVLVEKAKSPSN